MVMSRMALAAWLAPLRPWKSEVVTRLGRPRWEHHSIKGLFGITLEAHAKTPRRKEDRE
jgi:hypothetical protein